MNAVSFGAHVRAIRHERGLTQKVLADLAGLAEDTISRIETGSHYPYPITRALILSVLFPQDPAMKELWREAMLHSRIGRRRFHDNGHVTPFSPYRSMFLPVCPIEEETSIPNQIAVLAACWMDCQMEGAFDRLHTYVDHLLACVSSFQRGVLKEFFDAAFMGQIPAWIVPDRLDVLAERIGIFATAPESLISEGPPTRTTAGT